MLNKHIFIALGIHILLGLALLASPDYYVLGYLIGVIVVFNVLGIVLIKSGQRILGARIFMIASAILVPIGMYGAISTIRVIDEENRKAFSNPSSEPALRSIKTSEKRVSQQTISGVIFFAAGIIGTLMGAPVGAVGALGLLNIIIGQMQKDKPIVSVYDDYIETKLALFLSLKFIRFSQITRIDHSRKKVLQVFYQDGEKEKKLVAGQALFSDEDYQYLTELLESKASMAA